MDKQYFCWYFLLIYWRHKCLKNTIDLLLFYGEQLWIFGKWFMKMLKKKTFISQQTYLYIRVTYILKFHFVHIAKVCSIFRNSCYAQYLHKPLPTLGTEKEQQQIKIHEKSSGELIFSRTIKNLKIFYFTRLTGRVLKN